MQTGDMRGANFKNLPHSRCRQFMSEFGLLYGWIQIKSRACSPQYVATAHLSFTLRAHSQAPIFQVPFLCFTIYSLRLFFPLLYGFFVHVQIRAESLISLPSCLISLKGPFTCDALSACVSSSCGGPAGSVFIGDNHLFFPSGRRLFFSQRATERETRDRNRLAN